MIIAFNLLRNRHISLLCMQYIFFVLNSTEHEIFPLVNVKMPTISILLHNSEFRIPKFALRISEFEIRNCEVYIIWASGNS